MIKYGKGFPMVINVKGLDEVIKSMDKFVKYNNTATRIAINDTARVARTKSLKATREDWNIKAKTFKDTSKLKPAKNSDLNAQFTMDSKSLPLKTFADDTYTSSTTPTGKKRKGGAGVKYKLSKKERGKKTLAKSFLRKSKFNGGRMEVFTRRPSPTGNADITAQYSITPTSMFNQEGYDLFVDEFKERFATRYLHQVARLSGGGGGGV